MEAIERIQRRESLPSSIAPSSDNSILSSEDPLSEVKDLISRGNFAAAVEIFTQSIKVDSMNFTSYLGRAICNLGRNQTNLAQDDSMKVVELNPQWPKINPQKEGWIKKGGQINTRKKKRWFILQSYFLYYYNTKESSIPNGVIPIYHAVVGSARDKKITISIQNRTYSLYFDDKELSRDWLNVLKVFILILFI